MRIVFYRTIKNRLYRRFFYGVMFGLKQFTVYTLSGIMWGELIQSCTIQ